MMWRQHQIAAASYEESKKLKQKPTISIITIGQYQPTAEYRENSSLFIRFQVHFMSIQLYVIDK